MIAALYRTVAVLGRHFHLDVMDRPMSEYFEVLKACRMVADEERKR